MGDIRESGQIEQDADGIIFLHRPDYFCLDHPTYTPTGEAELIVAKFRDGPRNKIVKLRCELRFQRFADLP
jgi:replicative DNA helicase